MGYHRPPPPLYHGRGINLRVRPSVNCDKAVSCAKKKKKKEKERKKLQGTRAGGGWGGGGGGGGGGGVGGERKHSSYIFRRNSMMPLLILGKKRTALQLIQIMHVCLALILFASNLELLDQLKHKQESYNLKHLSAGEFSTSA